MRATLAGSMSLLNAAETRALAATPTTVGEAATGEVDVTVGATPIPGVPRIGSMLPPPPHAAAKAPSRTTHRTEADRRALFNESMDAFLPSESAAGRCATSGGYIARHSQASVR